MSLLDKLARLVLPAPAELSDYPFAPSDVARYRQLVDGDQRVLDQQSWDDLLLASYSARLAAGTSIFGQQALHRRLHSRAGAASASIARVRALLADAPRQQALQQACEGLRAADCEIASTLWQTVIPATPRWTRLLPCLPVGLLASVALALVSAWPAVWLLVLGFWLLLMAVQMHVHEALQAWTGQRKTLQQMLRTHTLLAGLPATAGAAGQDGHEWQADGAAAARLNRQLATSPLSALPGAAEYNDWLWLANVRHYFRSRALVKAQLPLLRSSFERIAALDADLALVRHLQQSHTCWAEPGEAVAFTRVCHPLLADPAALSFSLTQQGAFISGQNGIGKSTLLRTIGLNLITARAFGFCYAAQARVARLPVYASMQSEDALGSGESLYLAELRRARELLALAAQGPAVFIIDEIFRGTNHLESISAAAAVLHRLAEQGLVIVSSHNLVLAPLLQRQLVPWCVSRQGTQLQLAQGVLQDTNGISLLDTQGFDAAITLRARRVFDWLSDYMAQPDKSASLLLL